MTKNFDIAQFLEFKPPTCMCRKCLALSTASSLVKDYTWKDGAVICNACRLKYVSQEMDKTNWPSVMGKRLEQLKYDTSAITHATKLASIARDLVWLIEHKDSSEPWPLYHLFELFLSAKHFVHFTSFGITHTMIGALKLLSHRVAVCGIVANVKDYTTDVLTWGGGAGYGFEVKSYEEPRKFDKYIAAPHQKLIIIDGLVMTKGSVNLTESGWDKVMSGHELLEISTDISEIMQIHNRLFSPCWAEFSELADCFDCDVFLPF